MTELTLSARTVDDLQSLMRRVAYANSRTQPTLGHRKVEIRTNIQCGTNHTSVELPLTTTYVIVERTPEPTLTLKTVDTVTVTRAQVQQSGAVLLENVEIHVSQVDEGLLSNSSANRGRRKFP